MKLFFTIVLLQVVIISLLFLRIQEKSRILGISVSPLNKKELDIGQSGDLRFFYEPKANSISYGHSWDIYKAAYTINSDSLNERYDYGVNKDKDTFRIITLGDSFTYGLFVNTAENWTEILEDHLNGAGTCSKIKKYEVINLGQSGYDITYEIERYKKRGVKYSPDLIIWFLVDSNRITEEIYKEKEKNYNLWLTKEKLNENSDEFWDRAKKEVMSRLSLPEINSYQLSTLEKMNALYEGNILFLRQKSYEGDTQFPYMYAFTKNRPRTYIHETVSITHSQDFHFELDGHPNREGHKAIAKDVFSYLKESKLLPCK